MDEQDIRDQLLRLIDEIKRLPESKKEELGKLLSGDLLKKYEALHENVLFLQDTLSSLRLNIKYILFDLEITKKENLTLKKKLEEHDI